VSLDDAKIRELTDDVLRKLREAGPEEAGDLEQRVSRLEHASHALLGPSAGTSHCVLEPGQPCVGSGQCRTFGH
jgi:hypothetical protein